MSHTAGPSLFSSTSVPLTPLTKSVSYQSVGDAEFNGSQSATPAPEPSTPAVASTSALETDAEGAEQDRADAAARSAAQDAFRPDLEAIKTRVKIRSLMKNRSVEEEEVIAQTASRVASTLASDHLAVTYPDVDTPFADAMDAVKRLLPYHVFQHPKEDLDAQIHPHIALPSRKGKRKATDEDLLREEIAETKFAVDCWRRRRALQERFRRVRIRSGKRASPDEQMCLLAQAVLETERTETASINVELRNARAEHEKMEKEKRAAAPPPAPRTTATYYTTHPTTPTTNYATQFRGYTYPYATPYGSQYTYNPAAYSYAPVTAGTSAYANGTSFTPAATTSSYSLPTATSTALSNPSSTAPTQVPQSAPAAPAAVPSTKGVPVQLPIAALRALQALGVTPVPLASVPPADQPQPAVVLRWQTETTVSLEIDVASLQSSQMNGLASILNGLTSKDSSVSGSSAGGAGAGTGVAAAGGGGASVAAVSATSQNTS